MKKIFVPLLCFVVSCNVDSQKKSELYDKVELSKPLTEISGIVADGNDLWAITDKPHAVVYRLGQHGKLKQEIKISSAEAVDVEAVTADNDFVYIGDVGDNDGNRDARQIIKVAKSAIGKGDKESVAGELITFRFSDDTAVAAKKKNNNYDCEALLSFGDSLYLFTKRREDMQTELFSLSKIPGTYVARSLALFNSNGLVTDAAINKEHNEVAVIGYKKGHRSPFILLFKNFSGNNFLSGKAERIELADKDWDWQLEGISYSNDNKIYFACEETKQVKSTLYVVKREKLEKLDKRK